MADLPLIGEEVEHMNTYQVLTLLLLAGNFLIALQAKCEKPTPLGVGWNKRFWHEPYTIANGYNGIFDSESLNEVD